MKKLLLAFSLLAYGGEINCQLNWSSCPWTTADFPFETNNRRYAWSASLFLPSQIGGSQSISSIQFRVQNAGGWSQNFSTIRVYLRHSTLDNYPNGNHPDPSYGSFTQVYAGNLSVGTTANTVYTINFNMNTPFVYNGNDQLELLIENHSNVNSDLDARFSRTDLRPISDGVYNGKHGSGNTWESARDFGVRRPYSLAIQLMESCGAYPLPVTLTNAYAECTSSETIIHWTTASEQDNDFFTIERSNDGANWREIAKVGGSGTKNSESYYNYTDAATNGLTYYRLSQTDFNGDGEMLRILAVDCNAASKPTAYPNPFDNELIVNTSDDAHVTVVNAMGQILNLTVRYSGNTLVFDTNDLPKGVYFVQVDRNGEIETIKVFK